ncbi:MAG: tail fiber domain-containing protein [Bacteroidota bacterium]
MPQTNVRGGQVADGSISRVDLNTSNSGSAVITKLVVAAGTGILINASSGADTGTGDVSLKVDPTYLDTLYPSLSASRAQNTVFAAPSTGAGAATFRVLTISDIPATNLLSASHADTTAANPVLGDLIYATGATPKWTRLAGNATSTKQYLTETSSVPTWATIDIADLPTVTVAKGGNGLTAVAAGSIIGYNAANTASAITSTTGLKVLQNSAGTLSWSATTGTGNAVFATSPTLTTPTIETSITFPIGTAGSTKTLSVNSDATDVGRNLVIAAGSGTTGGSLYLYSGKDGNNTMSPVYIGYDGTYYGLVYIGPSMAYYSTVGTSAGIRMQGSTYQYKIQSASGAATSAMFNVAGGIELAYVTGTSASIKLWVTTEGIEVHGTVSCDSDGEFFQTLSDGKYKEDVSPLEDGIDIIRKVRPVWFTWNHGPKKDQRDFGFIAQEMGEVLPAIVQHRTNGDLGLYYEHFTAYLAAGIQSVDQRVITQEENIARLKEQIEELKNKINALTIS